MTENADFKKLVRARMAETGLTYTAARQQLLNESDRPDNSAELKDRQDDTKHPQARSLLATEDPTPTAYERARREQEGVIRRFFDGAKLRSIPTKRKVRASVLLEIASRFEPGQTYLEQEFNDRLSAIHEDRAYLRRELVDFGYFTRDPHVGTYRLAAQAPTRPKAFAQEFPDWEALWLPAFLAS